MLPAVGVEKDVIFAETYKKMVGFQGICLGENHQIVGKKKMIINLRRALGRHPDPIEFQDFFNAPISN